MKNILNEYAINILLRRISVYGTDVEFVKPKLNKYNEVTDEYNSLLNQKCLYHIDSRSGSYSNLNKTDSGANPNYFQEMLLTPYNNQIKVGIFCFVNNKKYEVTEICNYNLADKILDVSICEVKNL